MHLELLQRFNDFARSLRLVSRYEQRPTSSFTTMPTISSTNSKTQLVYRRMRFIPKPPKEYASAHYSGNKVLEDYIFNTKEILDKKLPNICAMHNDNLTTGQRKAIKRLQRSRNTITVKAADKNLGCIQYAMGNIL